MSNQLAMWDRNSAFTMTPTINRFSLSSNNMRYPRGCDSVLQHPYTKRRQRMTTSDAEKTAGLTHRNFRARRFTGPDQFRIAEGIRYVKPTSETQHRISRRKEKTKMPRPIIRNRKDTPGIDVWENRKLRTWHLWGRITDDGVLRMKTTPARKFYAKKIKRLFPSLSITECQRLAIKMYGPTRYRCKKAGTTMRSEAANVY